MSEADLIERAERAEERARTAEDILRRVFPDLENLRAENVLLRSKHEATPEADLDAAYDAGYAAAKREMRATKVGT